MIVAFVHIILIRNGVLSTLKVGIGNILQEQFISALVGVFDVVLVVVDVVFCIPTMMGLQNARFIQKDYLVAGIFQRLTNYFSLTLFLVDVVLG
jgi:hypothetical protein